jgi:GNAT superfamily N-acetyltransferase
MKLTVRKATLEDLPVLKEFEQGLIRDERPFDPTIRPDPVTYYSLETLLQDPTSHVAVAEGREGVVACGYATRKVPRHYLDHQAYAYFGFMYTRPEYRRQGINRQIMEVLKAWAREQGLHEIRLTVYRDNLPAIRAYEKAGFREHIVEMRQRLAE